MADRAILLVACLNVCSLPMQKDEAAHDMNVIQALILCLTETWRHREDCREIQGYRDICSPERPNNFASGVTIYFKQGFQMTLVQFYEWYDHGEMCAVALP
ncbi:hypothetical protein V5799_025476 [Amblyomma americanum]|uniref:Secreted protein n=1 Tax=Amblyomma americanum TaxID=6943 RepID=A0AAQ4E942_AMBAM